jgi:hypothetical protein
MKKIVNLVVALLLLTSMVSVAAAENAFGNHQGNASDGRDSHARGDHPLGDDGNLTENETGGPQAPASGNGSDEETEHDIEVMNSTLGAQIRLLQLEKALLTNLLKGAMAVQVLKGLNVTTTSLETILSELHTVLLEVQAVNTSENDTVERFIELKNESRNLTKQFRETLQSLVTNETMQQIKDRLQDLYSDELHNCTLRIHWMVRQFNANQLYRLYGIIGDTNTSLINAYINGNLTLNQTKLQIHKIVNQLTREKQQMIYAQMNEEHIKRKVWSYASMDAYQHHGRGHGPGGSR